MSAPNVAQLVFFCLLLVKMQLSKLMKDSRSKLKGSPGKEENQNEVREDIIDFVIYLVLPRELRIREILHVRKVFGNLNHLSGLRIVTSPTNQQ